MMDFPTSPTVGQASNGYVWNGTVWSGGPGTIPDGDKGDVVVSNTGTTWLFDSAVVTTAAKTVLDDADVTAMRSTLGLGNVDNTSDANKPVSTAQSTADALRVLKTGDTMTGNLNAPALAVSGAAFAVAHGGATETLMNVAGFSVGAVGTIIEHGTFPLYVNRVGSNGTAVGFHQSGTGCGSITVANATSTAYNTSSDGRLKEDRQAFDAGPLIDATTVYDFKWKDIDVRGHGVIAQDANEIFPEAVFHDGAADTWGVDYSKYVPLLLQEVKALRARVAALEAA
jgi:hypothetical protein